MSILLIYLVSLLQVGEMAVLPTKDPEVFRLIYKGDMSWNVVVTLLDENNNVKFEREVKDSDSFLMPLNLGGESSGTFTVKISTPAYDIQKQFEYITYEDRAAELISIKYQVDRNAVSVEASKGLRKDLVVYIYNESGDQLILDTVPASESTFYRVYNLKGAPARELDVHAVMSGKTLRRERFTF